MLKSAFNLNADSVLSCTTEYEFKIVRLCDETDNFDDTSVLSRMYQNTSAISYFTTLHCAVLMAVSNIEVTARFTLSYE